MGGCFRAKARDAGAASACAAGRAQHARCSGGAAPRAALGDLPAAAVAAVLRFLPLRERCAAAAVCRAWAGLVASAAAHDTDAGAAAPADGWAATRTLACELEDADSEPQQRVLQRCAALAHVGSARVTAGAASAETLRCLRGATRLVLLDAAVARQRQGIIHHDAPAGASGSGSGSGSSCHAAQLPPRLRVLSLGLSSQPLLDLCGLPPSLRALHLDLASGCSPAQLAAACQVLAGAAAAGRLPVLTHLTLGVELDALLTGSHGAVLNDLAGLSNQLTSFALVEYSHAHPEAAAHEGYTYVPPVLAQLRQLQQLELRVCSGERADLTPAAAVPHVSLVLTLARHEQTPFNRLPPSLTCLTGLRSLAVLMAEFSYEPDADLYVFDASPLSQCPHLSSLLLELHGTKGSLHDVRGLASLGAGSAGGLEEAVLLFKCPDVDDARQEAAPSGPASVASAGSGAGEQQQQQQQHAHHGGGGPGKAPGLLGSLWQALPWARAVRGGGGGGSGRHAQQLAAQQQQAPAALTQACAGGGEPAGLANEEWVLRLLDHALDAIRPEFAVSVPRVRGTLLIATTSRLLLRQPELFAAAARPALLASHLQLDLASSWAGADYCGGDCFLARMSPSALASWVARCWRGVSLLPAARYPQLGGYPGARRRVDDRLLVAARRGVRGGDVVAQVMATAEARCLSYFS